MSETVHLPTHSKLMQVLARITLVLILAQFALAGAALFMSSSLWAVHGAVGATMGLPIGAMLWQTRPGAAAAVLRLPCLALFVTYVLQVVLAAVSDGPGLGWIRSVHVANAALVVAAGAYVALRSMQLQHLP